MKTLPEDARIEILSSCYNLLPLNHTDIRRELDLGCGSGSFTTQLAKLYPESQIFGADIMIGRLRKISRRIGRENTPNLRLLRVESRFLCQIMLPDQAFDRVHLLCPDPWPKARHKGHRLLSSDFVSQIHRVLKPGGVFHYSSDDQTYFESAFKEVFNSGLFAESPESISDIQDIKSDFEKRWLALDKPVCHFAAKALPRPKSSLGH